MLALGSAVAGVYVIAAPMAAPAAGTTVNGAFNCTVLESAMASTKRISDPQATAWPGARPWAAVNSSRPAAVQDATVPPLNGSGAAPSAAWNIGPYAGAPPCW